MVLTRRGSRASLATLTAAAAFILGMLAGIGGLALALAVLSTPQPRDQAVTAFVLFGVGAVNVVSSLGVRRWERRARVASALACVSLMIYFAAGLHDFGELFWAHGVYLLMLLVLHYEMRHSRAAEPNARGAAS